jgi:GNAT superfamily N-acetyltransferase
MSRSVTVGYEWRGDFDDAEMEGLRVQAFEGESLDQLDELDQGLRSWKALVHGHSLGWVVARSGERLVGFVTVPWDGNRHAWIQDLMVATEFRRQGVGTGLVVTARHGARDAGCEWLHVDFDEHLRGFYFDACDFIPTSAGLIHLR